MTWRCSWQDYRGWHWPMPKPAVEWQEYATREDASDRAEVERKRGMTVCVSPTPIPARKRRKDPSAFNAGWKLKADRFFDLPKEKDAERDHEDG